MRKDGKSQYQLKKEKLKEIKKILGMQQTPRFEVEKCKKIRELVKDE